MSEVAICFFGIPRSLNETAVSINQNIIEPLKEFNPIVLGHFFEQTTIVNERNNESGTIDFDSLDLLPFDSIYREAPDEFLDHSFFDEVKYYGDEFSNSFQSIRNLLHQLKSLSEVTHMAVNKGAKNVLFLRPDIMYHDSFGEVYELIRNKDAHCFIPNWQHWSRGYNDRFAVCNGIEAIKSYGRRYERVLEYLRKTRSPLHPEKFLKYCLTENKNISVKFINVRGSRVRVNGHMVQEDFMDFRLRLFFNTLQKTKRMICLKS